MQAVQGSARARRRLHRARDMRDSCSSEAPLGSRSTTLRAPSCSGATDSAFRGGSPPWRPFRLTAAPSRRCHRQAARRDRAGASVGSRHGCVRPRRGQSWRGREALSQSPPLAALSTTLWVALTLDELQSSAEALSTSPSLLHLWRAAVSPSLSPSMQHGGAGRLLVFVPGSSEPRGEPSARGCRFRLEGALEACSVLIRDVKGGALRGSSTMARPDSHRGHRDLSGKPRPMVAGVGARTAAIAQDKSGPSLPEVRVDPRFRM
jgi:hypothetical protein